jgi:hypothetical protein
MDEDTDVEGQRGGEADPRGPGGPAPGHADTRVEVVHDGPPPPPFVRARRRRRQRLLLGFVILVVVGTPLGLAIQRSVSVGAEGDVVAAGGQDSTGAPDADPDPDPERDPGLDPQPDTGVVPEPDPEAQLVAPDLAQLEGLDATYGRLLIDIDASEQVMLDLQDDLMAAFLTPGADEQALLDQLSAIADGRLTELLEVRARLGDEVDDAGAEQVRETYLDHLDAWADYLRAIADDPSTLLADDGSSGYDLMINVTADTFARTLEDRLPTDIHASVARFATGILERGFAGLGEAQV